MSYIEIYYKAKARISIIVYANIYEISPMLYFFDIPRIFLEQKLISHG